MDLNALWQYLGELINQGVEWMGANYVAILATLGGTAGVGGIGVIAVQLIKVVVPVLRNSNKPILAEIASFAEKVTPQIESLVSMITVQETKLSALETENRTLKDYLVLSAETNSKSMFLDAETKARFAALAMALKTVPNAVVQNVAVEVEKAIADDKITSTEALSIASKIPAVEKVLGTPISDIIPKGV